MEMNTKTVLRSAALVAVLLASPLALSRAKGVTGNDAQCKDSTTCCVQQFSKCCPPDTFTCNEDSYDHGVGKCP